MIFSLDFHGLNGECLQNYSVLSFFLFFLFPSFNFFMSLSAVFKKLCQLGSWKELMFGGRIFFSHSLNIDSNVTVVFFLLLLLFNYY